MAPSNAARLTSEVRKMLGVRPTAEERRLIAEAAAREHRSVSSFVLRAALEKARIQPTTPRRSQEEVLALFKAAREGSRPSGFAPRNWGPGLSCPGA